MAVKHILTNASSFTPSITNNPLFMNNGRANELNLELVLPMNHIFTCQVTSSAFTLHTALRSNHIPFSEPFNIMPTLPRQQTLARHDTDLDIDHMLNKQKQMTVSLSTYHVSKHFQRRSWSQSQFQVSSYIKVALRVKI